MQNIFDSHAHYDDPRFDEDRDALLGSMAEHGVRAIMNVGNTTHANLAGIELAKQYPFIYCSIGIHPDQAAEIAAQNSRESGRHCQPAFLRKSDGFRRNRTGLLLRRCLSAGCPAQNL